MNDITALAQRTPERKRHNWSQSVMHDCDFCNQWSLTVKREDGARICASCCDAEYTSELEVANAALVEALEKAQQKIVEIQQGCENDPRIHEIIDLKEHVIETNDVLCNLLPDCRYMDPPDGGSVTPLEQVSRMVADYRQRIAELESEVKFPGVMHCNSCGFSRSHVIVTPGGMRAGESTPEHCPNGCGPMWHDTYRRQYNEIYDAYKALESRTVTVKLTDVNEYLAEVHDKTLALTFRRLAEGVRNGDVEEMRAAGIQVIEGEPKNG